MYKYKAVVYEVVDGDTFKANVDVGFGISFDTIFRMDGINAPELKKEDGTPNEAGIQAKEFLSQLILGNEVELHVHEKDKYRRWLATVYKGAENINQKMLESGHAVEYMKQGER